MYTQHLFLLSFFMSFYGVYIFFSVFVLIMCPLITILTFVLLKREPNILVTFRGKHDS